MLAEVTSKPLEPGFVWSDGSRMPEIVPRNALEETLDIELLFVFQTGCFHGGQMDSNSFSLFCLSTGIECEETKVTEYDTHSAYCAAKLDGSKSINFHQFQEALRLLSSRRFPAEDAPLQYAKTRRLAMAYDPDEVVRRDAEAKKTTNKKKKKKNSVSGKKKKRKSTGRKMSEGSKTNEDNALSLEEQARQAFAKYDTNNNNHIDLRELRSLLRDLGFTDDEINSELAALEVDETGIPFEDFVTYFNRLQTRRRGKAAADAASMRTKVKEAFFSFCVFGATRTEVDTLDSAQFAKLCRDCHLLGRGCRVADVDVIFQRARPKGRRVLPFAEFETALRIIAAKLYPKETPADALGNVYELIVGTGRPMAIQHDDSAIPGVFSSLHDSSNYTGVQRFSKGAQKQLSRPPSNTSNGSALSEEC